MEERPEIGTNTVGTKLVVFQRRKFRFSGRSVARNFVDK